MFKTQIINNICNSLIESSKHVVIKNDNLEKINIININKKIDLLYYSLLKNNTNLIKITL